MALKVPKRVAIACVTFETAKIVQPISYLGNVDRVYLFHYERDDPGKKRRVYDEFYYEVLRQLKEISSCPKVEDRNVMVYKFKEVLPELLSILRAERDEGSTVYINLSAGTSEFVAAATVASMMFRECVVPFTVGTKEWTVPEEGLRIYFDGDRPVGMAREVFDPQNLPTFRIERPPEDLVEGLKVLREKLGKGHRTTYVGMIDTLKEKGCWKRDEKEDVRDKEQAEKMYYARHFIKGWENRGWVKADERGRLELTDDGLTVTEVF